MDEKNILTNEELTDILSRFGTVTKLIDGMTESTEGEQRTEIVKRLALSLSKYDNIGCWATRDRLGLLRLWLGTVPPAKDESMGCWLHEDETPFIVLGLQENLCPYIKWEDSTPMEMVIERA